MKRNVPESNFSSQKASLNQNSPADQVIRANLGALRLTSEDFFSYYNLAKAYELKGLYNEAVVSYQKAIALNDEEPHVHLSLGDLLCRQDRFDEARASYQRAITVSPRLVPAHIRLARLLDGSGDLQEAIVRLKRALNIEPDNSELHYLLARLYEKADFLNEAAKRICCAVDYAPGHFYYHYYKACIYFRLKNWDPALSALQAALNIDPEEICAQVLLGKVYFYKTAYEEALQCFQKVLELEPNQLEALYYSGKIGLLTKDTSAAEKCFFRVFAINPDFRKAYVELAQLYALRKEWRKALHYLQQSPAEERADEDFLLLDARVRRQLGQGAEALSIVEELGNKRIFKSSLYLLWGEILLDLLKPEEARQKLRLALEMAPESAEVRLRLAEVEEMLGNVVEAERYAFFASGGDKEACESEQSVTFRGIIESQPSKSTEADMADFVQQIKRNPEDESLYLHYGDALFAVGELDKALQQWQIGLALKSPAPEFLYRIAEGLRIRGDLSGSNSRLEELKNIPAYELTARIGLARNSFESGNISEARELLENLTLRFPESLEPMLLLLKISRFCDNETDIQRISVGILGIDEQNIAAKAALGSLAMRQGNLNRANELYLDIANKTAHQDREALFNLGLIEKIRNNLDKSNEYFLRIISFRPEDAYAHYNLGQNFMTLGNYFMAEHHFKSALRWEPSDHSSRLQLAILYQEQGTFERAVEHLLLLAKSGSDAMVSFQLGLCFSSLGQPLKAVRYFEEALRFEYRDPTVYYHLAGCLSDTDEKSKALAVIEKGISFCEPGSSLYSFSCELRDRLVSELRGTD
jgi:tetratricopeptide (TPR) repeat protein